MWSYTPQNHSYFIVVHRAIRVPTWFASSSAMLFNNFQVLFSIISFGKYIPYIVHGCYFHIFQSQLVRHYTNIRIHLIILTGLISEFSWSFCSSAKSSSKTPNVKRTYSFYLNRFHQHRNRWNQWYWNIYCNKMNVHYITALSSNILWTSCIIMIFTLGIYHNIHKRSLTNIITMN